MARKSRRQTVTPAEIASSNNAGSEVMAKAADGRIFHAALYARLSLESEANRERNMIETQMQLLHSYVDSSKDKLEGKCVAGIVCYGLMKDPKDKNRIVPDPEAAPIVRDIFDMFIEGKDLAYICRQLNDKGIVNPAAYRNLKAGRELPGKRSTKWGRSTIRRLLSNRYLAGDSVHNQYTNDSFAEKKMTPNPESDWIIVENTHEAVIPRDIFQKAQDELARRAAVPVKNPGMYKAADQNLFKGKIKCADCGNTMYLQTHNVGATLKYVCGGYMLKKNGCKSHSEYAGEIYDETLRVIHTHIKVYIDTVDMVRRLNS